MKAKLKQGIVINSKSTSEFFEGYTFSQLDDSVIFTDKTEDGFEPIYVNGKKLYFPKNHELSSCGFSEDLFDIIN